MRVWTWGQAGREPALEVLRKNADGHPVVYDEEDREWARHDSGWVTDGEAWEGTPLHWSVLLEVLGPVRDEPRQAAPSAGTGGPKPTDLQFIAPPQIDAEG